MTGEGIFQYIMRFIHYDSLWRVTSSHQISMIYLDPTSSASPSAPAPGSDEFSTAKGVLWGSGSLQMTHAQWKWSPSVGIALWLVSLSVPFPCFVIRLIDLQRAFNGSVGWETHSPDVSWHFRTETDGKWLNYMQNFPKILYMITYNYPKRLYIIHYTQMYTY